MGMKFEKWLEEELRRGFGQVHARPPAVPRYASLRPVVRRNPLIHSIAAIAKSKVAIAATAITLAAGGGVGAKAAVTGDPNPFHWGQKVKNQVANCKQNLAPGDHGIGKCVSDFAKQHGPQERQAHSKAGSHSPGKPAQGKSPAGPPSSHPAPPASPGG
jgi:hypothetical protein